MLRRGGNPFLQRSADNSRGVGVAVVAVVMTVTIAVASRCRDRGVCSRCCSVTIAVAKTVTSVGIGLLVYVDFAAAAGVIVAEAYSSTTANRTPSYPDTTDIRTRIFRDTA